MVKVHYSDLFSLWELSLTSMAAEAVNDKIDVVNSTVH